MTVATVGELMSRSLVTITTGTTVAEAATLMGERRVGSALVVDGDRLLGIFTERDIVRALGTDFDAPRQPVEAWMTPEPVSIAPTATARLALDRMLEGGFRHLPVIEDERLVGVISMRDLSRGGDLVDPDRED